MKRKRFSVEQIVAILNQARWAFRSLSCAGRQESPSRLSTAGKKQYVGQEIDQVRQLKQLQEEMPMLG